MAKRRARNLQNEAFKLQQIAHAEGKEISEQDPNHTPSRSRRSNSISDDLHTLGFDQVKYANPYETPMCSDWVMDATTEYMATETYGSHAHSPEVVNSTSLRQGTTSQIQSTPTEKVSDAWKEGMESRMDFLQTNLTELLQLINQGVGTEGRRPVPVVQSVATPMNSPHSIEEDVVGLDPSPNSKAKSLDSVTEGNQEEVADADLIPPSLPRSDSPQSGDTILLNPETEIQDEHTTSECAPLLTSPESSRGTNIFPTTTMTTSPHFASTATTLSLSNEGRGIPEVPTVGQSNGCTGIVTRGVWTRKRGACSKVPPEYQPAKKNDAIVPDKKSVWIIHPEHREIVVAAGRTGLGPKSKLMKDGRSVLLVLNGCTCFVFSSIL
ncbi:hypothetical protein M758_UG337400 [Ceratodon purpureus]|nr:hypothetical protein M758_UG337400 [Ceratodon purpureus]